jgi:hypothetical protein
MTEQERQIIERLIYEQAPMEFAGPVAWRSFELPELPGLIFECRSFGDLPIYLLEREAPPFSFETPVQLLVSEESQAERIASSGLWRFRFPARDGITLDNPSGRALRAVKEAAFAFDGRSPLPLETRA